MTVLRPLKVGLVGAVAFVTVGIAAPPATADIGVGISANPVALARSARAGHTYRLPPIRVLNSGTEAATYHLSLGSFGEQDHDHAVPASWVRATPNDFVLEPKQAMTVALVLRVPKGAPAGDYFSGLKAIALSPGESHVTFGAAAATKLTFRVTSAPSLVGSTLFDDGLVAGALAVTLLLLARLFGFRLEIARRSPVADGLAAIERAGVALSALESRRHRLDRLARRARNIDGLELVASSTGL